MSARALCRHQGQHGDYDTDTFNLDGSIASLTALGYGIGYTAKYAPFGGLATATMGAKPITVTDSYNKRLQPATLSASTTAATIMSLSYNFGLGTNDNGNVLQITNNRDGNRTQNFMYDSLNRIQQAYTTGPNWGETMSPTATAPGVAPTTSGIDAWGNLINRSGVTGKTSYEGLNCPADNHNRLTACSLGYDAAGNMTSNGSATYTIAGHPVTHFVSEMKAFMAQAGVLQDFIPLGVPSFATGVDNGVSLSLMSPFDDTARAVDQDSIRDFLASDPRYGLYPGPEGNQGGPVGVPPQ